MTHAVLGAAMDGPASTPELLARLQRDIPVWRFSESSVYDAVRTLTDQGLLRVVDGGDEEYARTYEMTGRGRARLRTWVRKGSELGPVRDDLRQQVACSDVEDLPELARRVERRIGWILHQMEALRDVGDIRALRRGEKPWAVIRLLVARAIELGMLDGMLRGWRRAHGEIVEAMERYAEQRG